MTRYAVWDPLNESEIEAEDIVAARPEEAAELYAERDVDGRCDGAYDKPGKTLRVRSGNGEHWECTVLLEYTPHYDISKHSA